MQEGGRIPDDAHLIPLSTPPAVRSRIIASIKRMVATMTGTQLVPVRLLEVDDDQVSEGRLAFAENPPSDVLKTKIHTDHPNGAIELVETILCVEDGELDAGVERYRLYLGVEPQTEGKAIGFDLGGGGITIISKSHLTDLLPGEALPSLPGFVGYVVKVYDLSVTRLHLESKGFPVIETAGGDIFVPSASLLGITLIFRQG